MQQARSRPPGLLGLLVLQVALMAKAEDQAFSIAEGSPQGTLVGTIAGPSPPYLIVPQYGDVSADLNINSQTGEIRTKTILDREKSKTYELSAIPVRFYSPPPARVPRS